MHGSCDSRCLQDPATGQAVEKVLNTTRKLADESGDIRNRYGLRPPQQYEQVTSGDATGICHPRMTRRPASTSSPLAKIRWIATDRDKLERLVSDLSYFISKPKELVPVADGPKSLVSMAAEDIGDVDSFAKLRMLLSSDFHLQHATGPESHLVEAARTSFETHIDDRKNFINPAHSETLQWAFRPPAAGQRWAGIPDWLRSRSGLYWVSGKAGCGKSTLMKHMYHHEATKELLSQWAAGSPLITGCFFFWYLGTPEQKTYEGLTRTLLHHILDSDSSLIPQLLPESVERDVTESDSNASLTLPTFAETQAAFERLSRTPVKACLFIDGLDEYSGGFQGGISFVKSLCRHPNIKVVVSSRPEPDFADAFVGKPMLRMQDLTKPDIGRYVLDTAGHHPYLNSLIQRTETQVRAKELLVGLIDKANGIFLWIVLACRLPELERRVTELREELGAMFPYMLRKFLRICHEVVSNKAITGAGHSDNLMGCARLPAQALLFPACLNGRYGGLLEIQWDVEPLVAVLWNPSSAPRSSSSPGPWPSSSTATRPGPWTACASRRGSSTPPSLTSSLPGASTRAAGFCRPPTRSGPCIPLPPHVVGGSPADTPPDMLTLVLAMELGLASFAAHYAAAHPRVSLARLPSRFPLLYHAIKQRFLCDIAGYQFDSLGQDPAMIRYLLAAGSWAGWGGAVTTTTPWDVWTDGGWACGGSNAALYMPLTEAFVDSGTVDEGWAARAAEDLDSMRAFRANLVGFEASGAGLSEAEARDLKQRGQRIWDKLFDTAAEADDSRSAKRRRLK
ncbi:hypothetical protein C8A05DRAFT_41428 [Staphylotrichum tortipilum]|uniref:NACHT domain-containing protein n=1 Tax=Staphylotrichum tortipilum TaxID=2831512 RepID=A0AAN6RW45_9PEZI|nr:hypothetical protein C8A05DRAFT_41428 [Staphylotrichum longicolle]